MLSPLYIPELQRALVSADTDPLRYTDIVDALQDSTLQEQAREGNVTLGMLRPDLQSGVLDEVNTDQEAADLLESEIQGLGIMVKFSVVIDTEAINTFYDGPPKFDSMLPKPPMRDTRFANRWEEFEDLMTGSAATVLIMNGVDAINVWRQQLGHWNIEAKRDLSTIRGRHAIDNHNNLLHGSDAPESALREIDILTNMLKKRIRNAD